MGPDDLLGYLSPQQIRQLLDAGAVKLLYTVCENPKHLGDISVMHWFDRNDIEIAHQTALNNPIFYRRSWGGWVDNRPGYRRSYRWNLFVDSPEELSDAAISYRVV